MRRRVRRCRGRIRTNNEIDEDAVRRIMERYDVRTKTEAVDLALQSLAGQPMTREEALAMEGSDDLVRIAQVMGIRLDPASVEPD